MSVKLTAAVVAAVEGAGLNVAAVCRDAGVSRKTFYKWVARYRAGGLDGLQERDRRPLPTPHRITGDVEDEVVRLRKELEDAGLDHGATTIQWHLGRTSLGGGSRRWRRCIGCSFVAGLVEPATEETSEVVVETVRSARAERAVADRRDGLDDRHRVWSGCSTSSMTTRGCVIAFRGPCTEATERRSVDDVQRGQPTMWGCPGRGAVRQRVVLLRETPRLRSALRSPAPP